MKRFILLLTVVFVMAVIAMPAHATIKKVAQTGMQFLKVDVSPRAAAMAGAYTLVGYDASALFSNPAGIAKNPNKFDVFFSQTQWIADISYNAFGLAYNLKNLGTFGLSGVFSDYGDIVGTRVADTEKGYDRTGNLDIGAYAIGLGYARSLTDKFTVGAQIKWTAQNLGENLFPGNKTVKNKVSGLAFDFGTIFYPGFKSFRFGMSIRNFSEEFKYQEESFELPLTFRVAFAMDVLDFLGDHENPLLVSVDALHPRDYTERINLGAEYVVADMIALRAGYRFNYDEEGLSAGLGFSKRFGNYGLRVDYSYSDLGVFSSVNRFALGFSF